MERVRIGVVGCGVMGTIHTQQANAHPAATVIAVADVVAERAEQLARDENVPKTYTSVDELLADSEIDAITIAMPTCYRTEIVLKAFARGMHVLNEKPIAINAAEVEKMIAAKGDLIAGCCSSRNRFHASAKAAAKLVAEGGIGAVRSIHCRCIMGARKQPEAMPPAWRLIKALNGGGILLNWGCYDLDYLMGITGWQLKPEVVLAQTWTIPPMLKSYIPEESNAETHFAALFRCAGGEVISFERAEYVTAKPSNAWKIVGDRGALHLHMTPGDQTVTLDRPDPEEGNVSEIVWQGEEDSMHDHASVVHDFIDAVLENRLCATPFEKALVIQKMSDAIYSSAETGQAVSLG